MNENLKICFLSSYIPRECGIATYTDNLMKAVKKAVPSTTFSVIAMDEEKGLKYPSVVKFRINQEEEEDYKKAAEYVNQSDCDVVSIQHEFGIYGGFNGRKILYFLKAVKKPKVITFHTIPFYKLKPYSIIAKKCKSRQKLLKQIIQYVDAVTVMTEASKEFLVNDLGVSGKKIFLLPHGAHTIPSEELKKYHNKRSDLKIGNNDFIISSFGLISPKKGLEYAIKAMPKIIKANPKKTIKYFILGQTHPNKPKTYLQSLVKLTKELGLEQNVIFDTRYLSFEEIYSYLANSNIYITPYYVKEQASSGTLSYAIACGCPVVSTPYIFAQDVIKNFQVGELAKFKNSDSIAEVINNLIKNPKLLETYSKNSKKYGQLIEWPVIGKKFQTILQDQLK